MAVFNLLGQCAAEFLVLVSHVYKQCHEYHKFKEQVEPQLPYEHHETEGNGTRVEGEYVGILHERQTAGAELLTERVGDGGAVFFIHHLDEALELGGHALLIVDICDVCVEEYLPEEIAFPWCLLVLIAHGSGIVEFVAVLLICEVEVYVAVVVGKLAL